MVKKKDFIEVLRLNQIILSNEIASTLYREVLPHLDNKRFEILEDYMKDFDLIEIEKQEKNSNLDISLLKIKIHANLKKDCHDSIITYTDWIGCRIVREKDYTVPMLNEIDKYSINTNIRVNEKLLDRVINFMHSQIELPLLGRIKKGSFKPNPYLFDTWKNFYQW